MAGNRQDTRLQLTTGLDQGVHVLTVSGEVDMMVRSEFREGLVAAVDGANSPLILDLSAVNYLDAGGFSSLIVGQKRMAARPDKLYVVVTNPLVRRLFSVLGLEKFFDLYTDLKSAMAAALKEYAQPQPAQAPVLKTVA